MKKYLLNPFNANRKTYDRIGLFVLLWLVYPREMYLEYRMFKVEVQDEIRVIKNRIYFEIKPLNIYLSDIELMINILQDFKP